MEFQIKLEELYCVGLLRRFMAIFYDSLLLFAVLFVAAALVYPLTHGQISLAFRIYLLIIWFLYFALPWLKGGQTLGMKVWRIQLQSVNGKALNWRQALIRFSMAIMSCLTFGLGFFHAIVDKKHRTWHDRISDTCIVLIPKSVNS
ncbi:MAG: RDD family protein [Gammaproteobacteria bacterium]|nr:MAG: RDD family protein [Gammaproteobacteria bacterium]RKZ44586.1 MAG: RDD family protein [Gammaproteobacteria bacterium]RKZ76787.1 MAG: RDD family protein [Gammaproteobacteria bacterium]